MTAVTMLWLFVSGFSDACAESLSAFVVEQVAASAVATRQSDLCLIALRRVEQRYHLPRALLVSIALAESGRPIKSLADVRPWPWTINADGTGLFLENKAAAIAWMQDQAPGHNFVDVGCMQVDLHYHPTAFTSIEEAFDPNANADYAARLLLRLYHGEAGGSWDLAVGLYHSHTSPLATEFRHRVASVNPHVLHAVLKGEPRYVRSAYHGPVRLTPGSGQLAPNVHRQPPVKIRHQRTACRRALRGRSVSGTGITDPYSGTGTSWLGSRDCGSAIRRPPKPPRAPLMTTQRGSQ